MASVKNKGKDRWTFSDCDTINGLSRNQRLLCKRYHTHMPFVSRGAAMGVAECKTQFSNEKWNCPTSDDDSIFGSILKRGTIIYLIKMYAFATDTFAVKFSPRKL